MKRIWVFGCALLAVSIVMSAQTAPTPAQNAVAPAGGSVDAAQPATGARRRAPEVPKGPTPHLADGTVDLSGVWNGGGPIGDIAQGMPKGAVIPMTPAAEKIFKSRQSKDDPEANCLPTGIPRIAPYPWRIVQTPTHVFFLFEGNIHSFRQIFTDGRKHPDDPDPTWYGHSIGHYEGDALVIDTVGFNDKFWFDFAGHPHTEQLHTIVVSTSSVPRLLRVYFSIVCSCQENQQDAKHMVGFAGLN